jgi:hypothetical protein
MSAATLCTRPLHLPAEYGTATVGRRAGEHEGPSGVMPGQVIIWRAGDRREFTGDWPGYCTRLPGQPLSGGCTLHHGHHGRCAP